MEPIPGAVEEASKTTPTGYASVKGRSANAHVDGLRPPPSAPAGGELPLAFRLEGRKESCWRLRCRRSVFAADAVSMLERTSLIASSPPPRQRSSNCSRPSASIGYWRAWPMATAATMWAGCPARRGFHLRSARRRCHAAASFLWLWEVEAADSMSRALPGLLLTSSYRLISAGAAPDSTSP